MSQNQQTRSKLIVDAVATGAAAFAPTSAVAAISKVKAIAGLAGFVLRLFRSKEPLSLMARPPSGGTKKRPARIREGSGKAVRSQTGSKGGSYHG